MTSEAGVQAPAGNLGAIYAADQRHLPTMKILRGEADSVGGLGRSVAGSTMGGIRLLPYAVRCRDTSLLSHGVYFWLHRWRTKRCR